MISNYYINMYAYIHHSPRNNANVLGWAYYFAAKLGFFFVTAKLFTTFFVFRGLFLTTIGLKTLIFHKYFGFKGRNA